MKNILVLINMDVTKKPTELQLRNNVPVRELLNPIISFLKCPRISESGDPLQYWLSDPKGNSINQSVTLSQAGIENSALLILNAGTTLPIEVTESIEIKKAVKQTDTGKIQPSIKPPTNTLPPIPEPQERREIPSVPASWKKITGNTSSPKDS